MQVFKSLTNLCFFYRLITNMLNKSVLQKIVSFLFVAFLAACLGEKKEKPNSESDFLYRTWQIQKVTIDGKLMFEAGSVDPQSAYASVKTTFLENGTFENEQIGSKKTGTWKVNGIMLYLTDETGKSDASEMTEISTERLVLSQKFTDWLGNNHQSQIVMIAKN